MTDEQRQRLRETAALAGRFLDGTSTSEEEAELLMGSPAVDLRTVPRDHWPVACNVTLPPDVQDQIEGRKAIAQPELDFIEDRLRGYHGVAWPDWIECRFTPASLFHAVMRKDLLNGTDPADYLSRE